MGSELVFLNSQLHLHPIYQKPSVLFTSKPYLKDKYTITHVIISDNLYTVMISIENNESEVFS